MIRSRCARPWSTCRACRATRPGSPTLVEAALREQAPHLEVLRTGDAVLARTHLGRERRVLLAGHLDTVPIADNLPSRRDGDLLLRLRHVAT